MIFKEPSQGDSSIIRAIRSSVLYRLNRGLNVSAYCAMALRTRLEDYTDYFRFSKSWRTMIDQDDPYEGFATCLPEA